MCFSRMQVAAMNFWPKLLGDVKIGNTRLQRGQEACLPSEFYDGGLSARILNPMEFQETLGEVNWLICRQQE